MAAAVGVCPGVARAQEPPVSSQPGIASPEKISLARDFLARIKKGLAAADKGLEKAGFMETGDSVQGFAEGEELLLRIYLPKSRFMLDGALLGIVKDERVLLSFRDFTAAVEFPITMENNVAEGWYIRETRPFFLDVAARAVKSDQGTFQISDAAVARDGDIYVPAGELSKWFGLDIEINISFLQLQILSDDPLPVEARYARSNRKPGQGNKIGPAVLPRGEDGGKPYAMPFVDVSTRSSYSKDGESGEAEQEHAASVRTAGDFAYGTLTTQSQMDKEEKLKSFRFNYKQESLEPDLLGPLKARRFEIGDVNPPRLSLDTRSSQGTGVRVTNADPLRSFIRPSTDITGSAFPGWDVELYRGNQLLAFQTVGDDGIYRFDDVPLFGSDNTYRVVLYGQQGEVREEELYVPVDSSLLARSGSAYDISVTRQDKVTYNKNANDDEDTGAPNLTALYEKPLGGSTALSLGFETGQEDGDRTAIAYTGLSTTLAETLFNLNTAVEHTGEMAAELVARRDIGDHQLRNEINVATEAYGATSGSSRQEIFSETFSANGPLPFDLGTKPRYDLTFDYAQDTDGNNSFNTMAGLNTRIKRVTLNQQFNYGVADNQTEGDRLDSLTSVSGNIGPNRLRATTDYEIMPDSQLRRVTGTYQRLIDRDLELELGVERQVEQKLTEGRAQLNWFAGFANISPGVSYNSDNDLAATLSTRFGLLKNPQSDSIKMFDRAISTTGALSAFVFLDANGDGQFNEGEEPVANALVQAPQAGLRSNTDEDGYAFFSGVPNLRLTDVFVDPDSLEDPYWIPGYEGASILPRQGSVATIQFPIHMSGEIDGTVYGRRPDGSVEPLRGVRLSLYDPEGRVAMSVASEPDGFYLLSKVPPGDYYLNIDDVSGAGDYARPAPRRITVGYEGTTLYAQNIYLQEGQADVPFTILSGSDGLAAEPEKLEGRSVVLNLGEYNSRLAMGLAWYRLKTLHGRELAGTDLLDKPSESYADAARHTHILRVALRGDNIQDAQNRCRALVRRDQPCAVELLPGALPQKMAEATAPEKT